MKNALIVIAMYALISACKNEVKQSPQTTWEAQKTNRYHLVRPIDFDASAMDVYGLPLKAHRGYIMTRTHQYWLIPVPTKPDYFFDVVMGRTHGMIDTIETWEISCGPSGEHREGLWGIKKLQVLCLEKNYWIEPSSSDMEAATVVLMNVSY